jgi:hypothetical protein
MPLDPKTVLMHQTGHLAQHWEIRLPAGVSYSDIFRPAIWSGIERLMRQRGPRRPVKDDIIRILGAGFDVQCLVVGVDAGYLLEYYAGKRPSPVAQVLDDLDSLPIASAASELKEQAKALRKRWKAVGVTRQDIASARRRFAQQNHPDTSAVDGQRLATANAVLDAALASLPEAA